MSRSVLAALGAVGLLSVAACTSAADGPLVPDPTSSTSSTTEDPPITAASTTMFVPTRCEGEFPLFVAPLIRREDRVRSAVMVTQGLPGPAPGADHALDDQMVMHWTGEDGVSFEIRWPAGSGPLPDSPIVVTQLVSTDQTVPCDVVRASAYGPNAPARAQFGEFYDRLVPLEQRQHFLDEHYALVTPAPSEIDGRCAVPIDASSFIAGSKEAQLDLAAEALHELLTAYVNDRSEGLGHESCFTIAGLSELQIELELHGEADIVRASGVNAERLSAETVVTFIGDGEITLLRERLHGVIIAGNGPPRLLFDRVEVLPDSAVGEDEAIAFVDEYLSHLVAKDYAAAAEFLLIEPELVAGNELVRDGASYDVLNAMPDFLQRPAEALERWCQEALCPTDYTVHDSVTFDAATREIEVMIIGDAGAVDQGIIVSAVDGRLIILTPPPAVP